MELRSDAQESCGEKLLSGEQLSGQNRGFVPVPLDFAVVERSRTAVRRTTSLKSNSTLLKGDAQASRLHLAVSRTGRGDCIDHLVTPFRD